MTRHCKTCPTPVTGIVRFCPTCRANRRQQAWKRQGAERRAMAAKYDIDAIPKVVGYKEREEDIDEDFRLVGAAVSQWLRMEGEW